MPDLLSRYPVWKGERSIHLEVFAWVKSFWVTPDIDLFTSRANKKVSRFCSFNLGDNPWELDALAIPWWLHLAYAFPPIRLLPALIQKFRAESTSLMVVAPF